VGSRGPCFGGGISHGADFKRGGSNLKQGGLGGRGGSPLKGDEEKMPLSARFVFGGKVADGEVP